MGQYNQAVDVVTAGLPHTRFTQLTEIAHYLPSKKKQSSCSTYQLEANVDVVSTITV